MPKVLIRVDAPVSDELASAFPALRVDTHLQTTIVGHLEDQQELQGVLSLLSGFGIEVMDLVTVPDES